jgi:uncharacterized protein
MKTYTLYISGMHCASCTHLITETLKEQSSVSDVKVSLGEGTVTFAYDGERSIEELAREYTEMLERHGYTFSVAPPQAVKNGGDWMIALPIALALIVGYLLLERAGVAGLIRPGGGGLSTAFIVGLVASVSTCLAVVGGLVLSVSATYAHEGRGWRPQVLFHAGRFAGFFVLGGLLGVLGDALQPGVKGAALLGVVASVVMLILGIHLLEVTKKVRALTLPVSVFERVIGATKNAGPIAPLLLGAATFFLPCGFTQSMQIVALATGDFFSAASTMTVYALGTFPVLALLSFGSLDLAKSAYRGVFFKTAGLLVILFAAYNLYSALAVFGLV